MIKVLLFDVDGVLTSGGPFSKHLAQDYGISPEVTSAFFKEKLPACLIGNADLKEELLAYLQQWGWQQSVDDFIQYWFKSEHNIDEPLIEAIQDVRQRGIPCYLATNQEKYRTAYILEQMGFAEKFDGMFSSGHIGYAKPQRAFFMYVLSQLNGIEANEIFFWDDTPANVAAAREAGLQAEIYTSFADFQRTLASL